MVTLSLFHGLIHVPNAHTGKLTPGSGCSEKSFLSRPGADTPARITGDSYKNGGEVNSTRRHSGMDVDPSGRDNHSGPGRRTKKTERINPYESLKLIAFFKPSTQ
uniref:Uncharacterized protein n=1 Tax=Utricularia reniformis TaxID=192314 RepID=A0A1Y0AYQ0_9LAMI|nr:hypothetical protein AEK19_MT0448 [Utricularia reniformis]ART30286.1 hypothetical protein AEK19_MT0448 [Utricularia reniformis]